MEKDNVAQICGLKCLNMFYSSGAVHPELFQRFSGAKIQQSL